LLGPGHANQQVHELGDDADLQLGVGNVLALSARSILGRSCLVARVFALDGEGLLEIGASGDRMVRPRDVSIRDHAALAGGSMVSAPIGRPAGFRAAAVAGRIRGRVVAVLEVIAPTQAVASHADELHWLATTAALTMDDMVGGYVEAVSDAADDLMRLADLTPRERQVLTLLAEGTTSARIAERLGISRNTARTHIQNVRSKLGVSSSLEAVALATRSGSVARDLEELPGA
jgi:DNA-binding CsgD family transcriptional regulator